TQVAFLGEYQLQFHFAGRLHDPLAVLDEAAARRWAEANPRELIVVNTLDAGRQPGPQPVAQQRLRKRWIQVRRAGERRRPPAACTTRWRCWTKPPRAAGPKPTRAS